ncbi:MAG TPA: T9SS type A sorting domain-containing protein, partial [Bacteroidia bacterium]|nr:T9SS type A sorting domain-containing protein [Bacteroidia bacterium]
AVATLHNKTAQLDADTNANNATGAYTSIVIANNTVNNSGTSTGFLIAEWALGEKVSYHELNITKNTMNGIWNGIQLYNVRGWGGVTFVNPSQVVPPMQVKHNMVYTSTVQSANPVGIKVLNSPGFNVSENGVSSGNPGNYVNKGLLFQNSDNSEIYGNIVSAGTCIDVQFDMLYSDMHCNWFGAYAAGFNLVYAYLRPDSLTTHGRPVNEEFNNLVPYTMYPWNSDIFVYESNVDFNKWIWNGAGTNLDIDYYGNTGTGSVISPLTGADLCNPIIGLTTYADGGANVERNLPNDSAGWWRADYVYEVQRLNTGQGSDAVASANIKAIIEIEGLIGQGQYATALTELAVFTPTNLIEDNYKNVLTIFATINSEQRDPAPQEKNDLVAIAEQQTHTGGAGVTLARGYLAFKYNLNFEDARTLQDQEINGTANLNQPCLLEPTSNTWLSFMDENGNDLEIEGTYVNADGTFIFDPIETGYYADLYPTTPFRIFSKHGSMYTVVSFEFKTLAEWLTASPFNLDLAGVNVAGDSLSEEPGETFDNHLSMTDGSNTITVGATNGQGGTDFLVVKRDQNNDVLWSRTWDGPVSGSDTATCMTLDKAGNIYVAGKVYNGRSFDVQILKYDTDGHLIWSALFADKTNDDNTPMGIFVDGDDHSVHISGTRDNVAAPYRYIKVWQCLPGEARMGQNQEPEQVVQIPPAEFFPSPSNGKLNIVLNGQTGGTLELFSLEGQLVYTRQITQNGEIELPAGITNGVYLLKFTGEGEPHYQKLVIQRND